MDLKQSLRVSLENVDKILSGGLKNPLRKILQDIEGYAEGDIQAELGPEIESYLDRMSLQGKVKAGIKIYLSGGKEVKLNPWFESPGLDARLEPMVWIENLRSHIDIEKKYQVLSRSSKSQEEKSEPLPLSAMVLDTKRGEKNSAELRQSAVRRVKKDLGGRISSRRTVSLDKAKIKAGPLNLEIKNHELEVLLSDGIPGIEYFQADLMGGTVVGSVLISRKGKSFELEARCSLSGLNANTLLPEGINEVPDNDAELSGQLFLKLPLYTQPRRVLQELELNFDLTHIGSRTLERFLYALDPYESNEAVVRQRKLLRAGTPRWINLGIQDGNLSLTGEVEAKGIKLDLPRIERFNLAELPLHRQLEGRLSGLKQLIDLLRKFSANSIYVGENGIMELKYSGS